MHLKRTLFGVGLGPAVIMGIVASVLASDSMPASRATARAANFNIMERKPGIITDHERTQELSATLQGQVDPVDQDGDGVIDEDELAVVDYEEISLMDASAENGEAESTDRATPNRGSAVLFHIVYEAVCRMASGRCTGTAGAFGRLLYTFSTLRA